MGVTNSSVDTLTMDSPRLGRRTLLIGILVFVVLATPMVVVWQKMNANERLAEQARFNNTAQDLAFSLENQMRLYELMLRGMSTLPVSLDAVSRDVWNQTIAQMDIQSRYPGLQGVGWARFLSDAQLPDFVALIRQGDRPNYDYFPKGVRGNYLIIENLAPEDWRNQRALGFDMYSEQHRRFAIDRARNSKQSSLTAPVVLKQETEHNVQTGVLLYVPVFRRHDTSVELDSVPRSVNTAETFIGTVYCPFRMGDFVNGVLGSQLLLFDITLFDTEYPDQRLFQNVSDNNVSQFQHEQLISIFGRQWTLQVHSTPEYEAAIALDQAHYILVLGALTALLISVLVSGYVNTRERSLLTARHSAAALRERELLFLNLIQESPVAKLMINTEGVIEVCNARGAELLGMSSEQMIGRPLSECLPNLSVDSYLPSLSHNSHGLIVRALRVDVECNGQIIPVELGISSMQHVTGAKLILTFIDLSARIQSEEQFREVVEASPNAIFLIGRDGTIELANKRAAELLGYTVEELIGSSVDRLVPDAIRSGHYKLRDSYFESPQRLQFPSTRDVRARHKSGHLVPVEIGLSPLHNGKTLRVQAVLTDITERIATTERLQKQAEELQKLNQYKSEFLANMSHELRTPLNSILILSEQLRNNRTKNLTDKQTFHADIIHRAGRDLLQLINDILDLSKIEAGRMSLQLEPTPLTEIVQTLVDAMKPQADSKGLKLNVITGNDLPTTFITDKLRLSQILRNLLSNAIKFTERGYVSLAIHRQQVASDSGVEQLAFVVTDTGIGIPRERIEEIFSAFNQIDSSTQKKFSGTGLGLTISRKLAELLDGTISVQSTLGEGSVFSLRIPIHGNQITAEPSPRTVSSAPVANAPCLLLIEDDERFANILDELAREYEFDTVVAPDGKTAIAKLHERNWGGIIIDLLLPDMNGWQLLKQIQLDPKLSEIPVQIISCIPEPHSWHDDNVSYLVKPVSRAQLDLAFKRLHFIQMDRPKQLLLVEDVAHEREHYAALMTELGFTVTACADAQSALQIYRQQSFDCIVTDIDLGDISGQELLAQMEEVRSLQTTAILINTGMELSAEDEELLRQHSAVIVHKDGDNTQPIAQAMHTFFSNIRGQQRMSVAKDHQPHRAEAPATPSERGTPRADIGDSSITREPRPDTALKATSTSACSVAPHIDSTLASVLIVDDDPRNIVSLRAMLEEFQLQVYSVDSGADAVHFLSTQNVDVIFMDIGMAGMDGYTTISVIRRRQLSDAKIITLTAHAMKGDKERCLAAGADAYLAKPVTREQIVIALSQFIDVKEALSC